MEKENIYLKAETFEAALFLLSKATN